MENTMKTISRNRLKAMMDSDASFHLIETLDRKTFEEFHLPGARNAPLDENFESTIKSIAPNQDDTIVVYCKDTNCGASAKAAERLESMGYTDVLDYEAGKDDWKQAGLPVEDSATVARS